MFQMHFQLHCFQVRFTKNENVNTSLFEKFVFCAVILTLLHRDVFLVPFERYECPKQIAKKKFFQHFFHAYFV